MFSAYGDVHSNCTYSVYPTQDAIIDIISSNNSIAEITVQNVKVEECKLDNNFKKGVKRTVAKIQTAPKISKITCKYEICMSHVINNDNTSTDNYNDVSKGENPHVLLHSAINVISDDVHPYDIKHSLKANLHQASDVFIGKYGGNQCVCNAVWALCKLRSQVSKNIFPNDSCVIDEILYKGDNLYGNIIGDGDMRYLHLDELPSKLPASNSEPSLYELKLEDNKMSSQARAGGYFH